MSSEDSATKAVVCCELVQSWAATEPTMAAAATAKTVENFIAEEEGGRLDSARRARIVE